MSKNRPILSDEAKEHLRREVATTMFPSNPDMGGREFYRLGDQNQRRIDDTIKLLLDFNEAQHTKNRELIHALMLLVPIAQRMQAACDKGDVLNFDNDFDAQDAIDYKAMIDTALALAGEHGYKPTPTHRPK